MNGTPFLFLFFLSLSHLTARRFSHRYRRWCLRRWRTFTRRLELARDE